MSWRSVPSTKESKKTLTHRGLAATGACGRQQKGAVSRCLQDQHRGLYRENPPCPPASRSLRCGNGRVVSADDETPGQEKSSSCVKKLGQQSRTTSKHNPVLSKKLGQRQLRDVDNSGSKQC